MARAPVAVICRSRTKILQNMHAHRARPAPFGGGAFHLQNQIAQHHALARAYFAQRVPHFWFEPHAGAAAAGVYVTIDKPAGGQILLRASSVG
jgi:hypothetical protein